MFRNENMALLDRIEALQAEVAVLRSTLEIFNEQTKVEIELEKAKVEIEESRELMKIEAEKQQEVLEENKREVEALKRSLQNVTRDQV